MSKNIQEILLEGNLMFQMKLLEGTEELNPEETIPRYPVLILTCMDSRIDVHRVFQLEPGDVIVLRNAGNFYTKDVLRAILIAIHEYNIDMIIILGHTDCAMTKLHMQELKEKLMHRAVWEICKKGLNPLMELRKFFRPFIDEFKNISNQIDALKEYKGFPTGINFIGMLYDVKTGWVFEMDKLQEFDYIEEFQFNLKELLSEKRQKLVDYLDPNENNLNPSLESREDNSDKIRRLEDLLAITENLNENDIKEEIIPKLGPISIKENPSLMKIKLPAFTSKIHIPKIIFPKINVSIPKIYKKNKEKEWS